MLSGDIAACGRHWESAFNSVGGLTGLW